MGDMFHKDVPYKFRRQMFDIIRMASQHKYLIFSKRYGQMTSFAYDMITRFPGEFNHVCWYASVSTQAEMEDAGWFLGRIPNDHSRGLSIEPLLEGIDLAPILKDYVRLPHIIIGCESGRNRRPCKLEWIENIVTQCQDADVDCYVKQIDTTDLIPAGVLNNKVSTNPEEWPPILRVRELPKP